VPSKRFGGQERCGPPSLRKAKNGAVRIVGSKDEEFLSRMLNDIRQEVNQVVEIEGIDQLQQVWLHGAMEAKQLQQESEENNELISKSLATLKAAHASLETEQCNMRHALTSMSDYLNHMKQDSLGSSECGSADSCSTPSTCATPSYYLNLGGSVQQASTASFGGSGQQTPHPVGCTTSSSTPRNQDQNAPVQMLSLASALGIEPPQKNLQSNHAASGPSSKHLHSAQEQEDADAFIFSLTLRVADAGDLGLALSPSGTILRIDFVIPGSAAEAWNRQCSCSGSPDRVLRPGDQIVSVNDVAGDAQAMINECQNRLVKFFIVRASASTLAENRSMEPAGKAAVQSVVLASPSPKRASWPSPASAPPASPPPGSPPCSPATPPPPTAPPSFGQAAPKAAPPTLPPALPLPVRSLHFGEPAPGACMLEAPPGLPMPPSMTLSGFPPSLSQQAREPSWLARKV